MSKLSYLVPLFLLSAFAPDDPTKTNRTIQAFTKSTELEKNGDYNGAISAMRSLNDSGSYNVVYRLGSLYSRQSNYRTSLNYYTKAIELCPSGIEAREACSFTSGKLNDHSALIAQNRNILGIDPRNRNALSRLAHIYYDRGDYKEARSCFKQLTDLYPFDYDSNLSLGWSLIKMGVGKEAEPHFKVALMYSPGDASAEDGLRQTRQSGGSDELINAFAKCEKLAAQSKFDEAIQILKRSYSTSSYFINLRLGWLSYHSGAYQEALDYYRTASAARPKAVEPLLEALQPAEKISMASTRTQCENILKLDPHNYDILRKLGSICYEKGDFDLAVKHLERIAALYPSDQKNLVTLAKSYEKTGSIEEAHQSFYKAVCLSPRDAVAQLGLKTTAIKEKKMIIKPKLR